MSKLTSSSGNWFEVYVPSNKKTRLGFQIIHICRKIYTKYDCLREQNITSQQTRLNIRKEPKITSEKLFAAKKNEELIVSDVKENWGKVTTALRQDRLGFPFLPNRKDTYKSNRAPSKGT